ncbi:ABC transporter ATP-binding protein [Zavarzinia sp. CC-PAN008]|uniref:ABC transporter ATP-binding protein n=1 Tax=Zavarzinia sp. CC-PAN008 TaxID=3243332 RepID=UPI003F743557
MALLEVEALNVRFGRFRAVEDVSFSLDRGEVLGLVGESGSGKSVTSLALMGLIPFPGEVAAARMAFDGRDLDRLSGRARRALNGRDLAMIFQEPMTSLNPSFTIGTQLTETLSAHQGGSARANRDRAVELLAKVGLPSPEQRLASYPHQLSGGQCQRIMIAMAIALRPRLLIADEPTTALDVTIQAQILSLLLELQRETGMALLLITHDLGVVARMAQRVAVMYAGEIVETGTTADLFAAPRHPYTAALLDALPERAPPVVQDGVRRRARLPAIPGVVPGAHDRPPGCRLEPRCRFAGPRCVAQAPALHPVRGGQARCHWPLEPDGRPGPER